MTAMSHGFGGRNTRERAAGSSVLQTKGIATTSLLLSYPSMSRSLNDKFLCLIGRYLARMMVPSHEPTLLRIARSELSC